MKQLKELGFQLLKKGEDYNYYSLEEKGIDLVEKEEEVKIVKGKETLTLNKSELELMIKVLKAAK